MPDDTPQPLPIPTPRDLVEAPRMNRAQRRAALRSTRGVCFSATFTSLDDLRDFLEIVNGDSDSGACE